eukprot:COSAG05_NODE_3419_length_2078_cov_1.148560_2_plen_76_part_00
MKQELISALAEKGNTTMTAELRKHCAVPVNVVASTYTCALHPALGDKPQQLVRSNATACSKLLQQVDGEPASIYD